MFILIWENTFFLRGKILIMEHMPIDKLLGLLNIFNEAICLPVPDSGSLNVLRLFSFTLVPF